MSHSSYHISPFSYDEASGTMDSGYPRSIENDFPGMGDEVDAAVYHYGTKLLFSVTQFQSQVNFLSSNFIVGFFFFQGFCISSMTKRSMSTVTRQGRSYVS